MLGHLQPLTPETSEDVEDLQAVEAMTIHGAHASGSFCFLSKPSIFFFSMSMHFLVHLYCGEHFQAKFVITTHRSGVPRYNGESCMLPSLQVFWLN